MLQEPDQGEELAAPPARLEVTAYSRRPSFTDPVPALTDLQRLVATQQLRGARSHLTPPLGLTVRPHERLAADLDAAHLGVVADLALTQAEDAARVASVAVPDAATSFRNLLTPAQTQRVTAPTPVWRTAPAVRARGKDGAVDAVEAHRSYQAALAAAFGYPTGPVALTARLGPGELASLRAAHERADWVITLDRNLGIDLFTASAGAETAPVRPGLRPRLPGGARTAAHGHDNAPRRRPAAAG